MLFFFYGTLMDRDVRQALLGKRASQLRVTPGVLLNYRRLAAKHGDYPVLVPALGGRVNGVFVEGLDAQALLWVAHFEGPTYVPGSVLAQDMYRQRLWPWAFLPSERSRASSQPWNFRRWQRIGKRQVRDDLNKWLLQRGISSGVPLALDVPWLARQRMSQVLQSGPVRPQPNPELDRKSVREQGYDEGDARLAVAAQ